MRPYLKIKQKRHKSDYTDNHVLVISIYVYMYLGVHVEISGQLAGVLSFHHLGSKMWLSDLVTKTIWVTQCMVIYL